MKNIFFLLQFLTILGCFQTVKSESQVKTISEPKQVPIYREDKVYDSFIFMIKDSINKKDKTLEEKICDMAFELKEIKEFKKLLKEKNSRNLYMWFVDTPRNNKEGYYWLKVGEDNGMSYVTSFHFHYYPKTKKLLHYDTVQDKVETIKEWRKRVENTNNLEKN